MKTIKEYLRVVLALLLFSGIFYGAYDYLNHYFKNEDANYGLGFRMVDKDTIDVLVLGSSHAQYSFSPVFFYEQTGLYSYVLGSACQPLEVSYEMLKEALKTQQPKVVVLEVFTATPRRDVCEGDGCYVIAAYQMQGQERINTFNYLEAKKAASYYNEFINNHNNWKDIDLASFSTASLKIENVYAENYYTDGYSDLGYEFTDAPANYPPNWWHGHDGGDDYTEEVELDELDQWALTKIYELCQERGIQLVFYKTPIDSMRSIDKAYLNKVFAWAEERAIPYVNFFAEQRSLGFYMGIHSDSYHLNVTGANIVTNYLAALIKGLPITFEHKYNQALQERIDYSAQKIDVEAIKQEHDPYKYLERLKNGCDYVFVRYSPYYTVDRMDVAGYLAALGVSDFKLGQSYFALIKNGEVIAQGEETLRGVFNDHGIYADNGALIIDCNEYAYEANNLSIACIDLNYGYAKLIKSIDTSRGFDLGYENYDNDR